MSMQLSKVAKPIKVVRYFSTPNVGSQHFKLKREQAPAPPVVERHEKYWENPINHPIWSEKEVQAIRETHVQPKDGADKGTPVFLI